jgi:hypothetical protein
MKIGEEDMDVTILIKHIELFMLTQHGQISSLLLWANVLFSMNLRDKSCMMVTQWIW